ncbi:MAG TPA: LysE family transporter [Actinomycetota bacterium]
MPAVEGGVRGEGVRPAVVLLGIAVWLGARALGELGPAEASEPERGGLLRIFSGFLGLTLLNPVTSVYFTALILGLRGGELEAGSAKVAFVAGAFLASLSWQWLLAGAGSVLRHRLPTRARRVTSLLGGAIVALLALGSSWADPRQRA